MVRGCRKRTAPYFKAFLSAGAVPHGETSFTIVYAFEGAVLDAN